VILTGAGNLIAKDSLATSQTDQVNLGVMNSSGIMITYKSGAAVAGCTLAALPAGTYIIEVTCAAAAATPYRLRIGLR
jgi:hypothetical protein